MSVARPRRVPRPRATPRRPVTHPHALDAGVATSGGHVSSRRCMVAGTENKWTVSSRPRLVCQH
eukprot:1399986-Prymnesium_polylepis.1